MKPILILIVLISALVVGYKIGPPHYEFYLMKKLADQVVNEYGDFSEGEVNKRVEYELRRINRTLPKEVFQMEKRSEGYKVVIDFTTPVSFNVGGREIPLGQYKELEFHYEVGK